MSRFFQSAIEVRLKDSTGQNHFDQQDASAQDRQIAYAQWCVQQIPDEHLSRFTVFCMGRMNFYDDETTVQEICQELQQCYFMAFYYCGIKNKEDEKNEKEEEEEEEEIKDILLDSTAAS